MISRKIRLTDGVIVLKPVGLDDVSAHFESIIASKKELMPWMPWCHAKYGIKDTKAWIQLQLKNWKEGTEYSFCILDPRLCKNLGFCGLNKIDDMFGYANLWYWVRSDATGQGLASHATRLLAQFGFQKLKLNRIEIVCAVSNNASRRVAEKVGAVKEGVMRRRGAVNHKPSDAVMFSLVPEDLKKI